MAQYEPGMGVLSMPTRRRIQGIFHVNDTVAFLTNLALQLSSSGEDLTNIDGLCASYELNRESAIKLSLAARLLQGAITEGMLESPTHTVIPVDEQSQTTLYVRNIPSTVPEHEIAGTFQNYGSLKEVRMQRDKKTGQFFGSAFVEYVHPSAARLAQIQMNNRTWGANVVHVDFAKEKAAKAASSAPGGPSATSEDSIPPSPTLFISGLPPETDRPMMHAHFARFGTINDVRLLTDKATGHPKGVAFIDFQLVESAAAAKAEYNGKMLFGRNIKVTFAVNPSKKQANAEAGGVNPSVPPPAPGSISTSYSFNNPPPSYEQGGLGYAQYAFYPGQ